MPILALQQLNASAPDLIETAIAIRKAIEEIDGALEGRRQDDLEAISVSLDDAL